MSRYTLTVEGPDGQKLERPLPSVTEILDAVLAKPGLHDWYYKEGVLGISLLMEKYGEKLPKDVPSLHSLLKQEGLSPYAKRDSAAGQGMGIHEAVLNLTKGKRPKDMPALWTWWKDRGFRSSNILAAEQVVYSPGNGYAGTLDLVYTEEGSVVLSDVKSGKIRESHALQLELYRWAWEELGNPKVDRLTIIQVPRDGTEVTETEIPLDPELTEAASGIILMYGWLKRGKKR